MRLMDVSPSIVSSVPGATERVTGTIPGLVGEVALSTRLIVYCRPCIFGWLNAGRVNDTGPKTPGELVSSAKGAAPPEGSPALNDAWAKVLLARREAARAVGPSDVAWHRGCDGEAAAAPHLRPSTERGVPGCREFRPNNSCADKAPLKLDDGSALLADRRRACSVDRLLNRWQVVRDTITDRAEVADDEDTLHLPSLPYV